MTLKVYKLFSLSLYVYIVHWHAANAFKIDHNNVKHPPITEQYSLIMGDGCIF